MKAFLIKNGLLVSPANGYRRTKKDVLVRDGKIARVEDEINEDLPVVDASGCIVTPGLIDIHTHCYPKAFLGLEPDVLGIHFGLQGKEPVDELLPAHFQAEHGHGKVLLEGHVLGNV